MVKRVQRSRRKGSKLPTSTRCVNRGTKWGNPYKVVNRGGSWGVQDKNGDELGKLCENKNDAAALAVDLYAVYVNEQIKKANLNLDELRNFRNLACWCSLDAPCHADFLIELLNKTD